MLKAFNSSSTTSVSRRSRTLALSYSLISSCVHIFPFSLLLSSLSRSFYLYPLTPLFSVNFLDSYVPLCNSGKSRMHLLHKQIHTLEISTGKECITNKQRNKNTKQSNQTPIFLQLQSRKYSPCTAFDSHLRAFADHFHS